MGVSGYMGNLDLITKANRPERKRNMAKQEEMEVGKRDAVGKAAIAYLEALENVAAAKENKETAAEKLIAQMHGAGRDSIKLEGVVITLRQMEAQEILKIKKPKQSKSE